MKILAVGDFEGKFPQKYNNIIKKEKIDLVVSDGDYPPFSLKELFFKHVYGKKDAKLWNFIGKKKYKDMTMKDLKKGEWVFRKLNKLKIPVFTVFGNHDYPPNDVADYKPSSWKFDKERYLFLAKSIKKYGNIKRFDYSYFKFDKYVFVGARGHSFPGLVKSKGYRNHRQKLEKLFKKFRKENRERKVIFVSHNVPYNTKLDRVTAKDAHKKAKGKHFGSKLVRRIIEKYQPVLYFGGHIDEGRGKQKIGKTLAVNSGPVHSGKGSIIEIKDKGKLKVKFIH